MPPEIVSGHDQEFLTYLRRPKDGGGSLRGINIAALHLHRANLTWNMGSYAEPVDVMRAK